jgi:hypothetical protein
VGPEEQMNEAAVAVSRTQLFAVWGGDGMFGTRLSVDGVSRDDHRAGPLVDQRSATRPSVASDGKNFLVVWTEARQEGETLGGVLVEGRTGRPSGEPKTYPTGFDTAVMFKAPGLDPRVVWDGSRYLVSANGITRDGGSDVVLLALDASGELLGTETVASSSAQELDGVLGTDGRGRTLAVWSQFEPDAGARRLHARSEGVSPLGGMCFASSECLEGSCGPSGCCEVDARGCFTPAPEPWRLRAECGCAAPGGTLGALTVLAVALRRFRRRARR